MKTSFIRIVALLPFLGFNVVFAHGITVDGAVSDWLATSPVSDNSMSISQGELTWLDASNDERIDLASPDPDADLRLFGVTADTTNLYFRSEFGTLLASSPGETMLQIAIDSTLDGAGQTSFWGLPETSVASSAAWEYIVVARPTASSSVLLIDNTFATSSIGSVAISASNGIMELSIPWASLGLTPASGSLRITTGIFRTDPLNPNATAFDILGNSDALDAVTAVSGNTWNEVSDGVIDFNIDVAFLPNGDVVPIPASVWLFGSGLLGLVGMARRKKAA